MSGDERSRIGVSPARQEVEQAFLDAAERLLIREGYAGITTRKLAEEAGQNHGLVHYYFGSMEELLMQVLERFTDRLIARQRTMYETAGVPFIEKWRTAMHYIDEDLEAGYPKVWFELQAMSWNHPAFRDRIAHVRSEWHAVLTEAIDKGLKELGVDRTRFSTEAMTTLVSTFNGGMLLDRLSGVCTGHAEMLQMIQQWMLAMMREKG